MTAVKITKWSAVILGIVAASVIGAAMAAFLPQVGLKALIAVAIAAAGIVLITVAGRPREVLLAAYIAALTYNRQYFSFDDFLGSSGSQGLYWIPADPLLVLLLATSFFDVRGDQQNAIAYKSFGAVMLPILPFLAVCCVSTLAALRPDWAANDTLRVVKFAVLLGWLHCHMTPSLWKTAVGTLAVIIVVQSALGILQVLLKGDASLLAMLGLAKQVQSLANEIENRARGTMGHPNILAPYLLIFVPAAFGAVLFARNRLVALGALAVTVLGSAAVFASKSRAPTALLAFALVVVALIALRRRVLSPRVALGGAIVLAGVLAVVMTPILTAVTERIGGDFAASVKFRADYNDAALAIWSDYPVLGIGPNNMNVELKRHAPLMAMLVRDADKYRDLGNTRAPTVHNIYFLMLAETGLLGFASFLFLLIMMLVTAVRAANMTDGTIRGLCFGVSAGLGAAYLQQSVDFSMWYDSAWYSLAVLSALVNTAPAVAAAEANAYRGPGN